jgi:cytochrome c
MNSFELNKVLGAILGTCLVLLAIHIGAGAIFAPEKPAKPGYQIALKEVASEHKAPAKEAEQPIGVLLAKASVEKGKATAKQCQACHTLEKGGPNRVGPNLWGVVDRPRASEAGFNYSAAMKAKGGKWTFEELNKFLTNPRGYISGTAMSFAGLARDQQRADVIAFLRTLSDNPVPLPKPESAPAPAAAAPAGKPAEAPKAGAAPAAAPAAPAK